MQSLHSAVAILSSKSATASLGETTLAAPVIGAAQKFDADGRVRPFAGNTVLCHLPKRGDQAKCFRALFKIGRGLDAFGFAAKLTPVPPSSYHMTIFSGANDQHREPGLWPAALSHDTPMRECNRWAAKRLKEFKLETPLPLRMIVNAASPDPTPSKPLRILLLPADEDENAKLRTLRDRLSECLQIRAPDHDTYQLHITLGYFVRPLTSPEQKEFCSALQRMSDMVAAASPEIELDAPEFCTFTDMFSYRRQFRLA